METLDEFLRSQNINLDELRGSDDEDRLETKSTSSSVATPTRLKKKEEEATSRDRRNKLTDSLLRNDVVAPNIVHFSLTYNSTRSRRRLLRAMAILLLVLALSIYGVSYFNKMMWTLSHEAVLDIESKNISSTSQHHHQDQDNKTGTLTDSP